MRTFSNQHRKKNSYSGTYGRSFFVGTILGLLLVSFFAWIYEIWQRGQRLSAIAAQLPHDTLFLINIDGWEQLYREYQNELRQISEIGASTEPVPGSELIERADVLTPTCDLTALCALELGIEY